MTRWPLVLGAFVAGAIAAGCADDETSAPPVEEEAERRGGGDEPSPCLDPEDPAVHYVSADPEVCRTLSCEEHQNGFDSTCGCGCVDKGALMCPHPNDPEIDWVSVDPATCAPEPPECPLGGLGFSNSCGCGCIHH